MLSGFVGTSGATFGRPPSADSHDVDLSVVREYRHWGRLWTKMGDILRILKLGQKLK